MNKAIFWDRDGVISEVVYRDGIHASPRNFGEFKLREGADKSLKQFRDAGFLNIVITNQPDVSRGLMEKSELDKMHQFLIENFPIDDVFTCLHDNSNDCSCRKPKPGLILEAAKKWNIDVKKSFVVGDTEKDTGAATKAGCSSILINAPYNKKNTADFRVGSPDEVFELFKNMISSNKNPKNN